MKYRLIASDLDGTLLNTQHRVSELTRHVIQKVVAAGIPFVIATGRHFLDVEDIRQTLDVEMYLITANGARVHNHDGEMIYQQSIDTTFVQDLLKPEFTEETIFNIYRDDGWFISQPLPWLLDMHQTSGLQYQLFPPGSGDGQTVSKVFYIADHAHLLSLQSRLEAHFGTDALAITFSMPNCLEVMHKTVSKGQALSQVAQRYGVSLAECLAFGDGLNDYELLSMVGKGIVMGNAHEALKTRLPNHECIGCHTEDSVARYLLAHYDLATDG